MKKKWMVLALVLSAGGFLGTIGFAAEVPLLSVRLGPAIPAVGDLKDIADTGVAIGAQAMHRVDPQNLYGIDVGYISFGEDSKDDVDTQVSIISTLALMQHTVGTNNGAMPFFQAGFGFARTQVNIAASDARGPAVTRGYNEEDISPTFLFGVGFTMPISARTTFGVSIDYQHFFFKVGDVDGGGSLNLLAHLRM
jgi:hypothetical protein